MNPSLHRYRRYADFYDCLIYGVGRGRDGKGPFRFDGIRMFGNSNIGNPMLTNMTTPSQFPSDNTFAMANWYAVTNIPQGPALTALASKITCTLIVGVQPQRQSTLLQLLQRHQGDPLAVAEKADQAEAERERMVALAARSAFAKWHEEFGQVAQPPDGLDSAFIPTSDFDMLEEIEQQRWFEVGRHILGELAPNPFVVIPVRQTFNVNVDFHGEMDAVNYYLQRLDEPNWDENNQRVYHLSRPPGFPADRPGIWIHLEGWTTEPVY